MARPGPAPKPTAQKIREGNPGRRPLNDDEPKPPVPISLAPPEWLDDIAKDEWRRLAEELESQNMLTTWDTQTFAAYCESYSMYRQAVVGVRKDGAVQECKTGYKQVSAWMAVLKDSRREMVKIGALLGLNPAERSRLSIKGGAKDGKSEAANDFGFETG